MAFDKLTPESTEVPKRVYILNEDGSPVTFPPTDLTKEAFNLYFNDEDVALGETTVITDSVPVGKTLHIQGYSVSGTSGFKVIIGVDIAAVAGAYASTSNPQLKQNFLDGEIEIPEGILYVMVLSHEEIVNQRFRGNLFGYLTTN